MKDYRLQEHRYEAFERYYVAQALSGDIDPGYPALTWLFENGYASTREQRYWWTFLYGVVYCVPTVFYIASYFPDFPPDLEELEEWHAENWRKLIYGTDRRYCKGHLVEMVESYIDLVGDSQQEYFESFMTGNPSDNFDALWADMEKLHRFGRYSLFYYTEALARCCGLPIECTSVMFGKDGGKSHTNGMLMTLGLDHLVDKTERWTPTLIDYLGRHAERIMRSIKRKYPDVPADYWYLETSWCAFKGLFRGRRYMGYYHDRTQEEILKMQKHVGDEIDLTPLAQMFNKIVPEEYNGW